MQPSLAQAVDHACHADRVRNGRMRECATRWIGRIVAGLPMYVIHRLGTLVVRSEVRVGDRPRRRVAVDMAGAREVLLAQAVEHATPEFGVSADTVMYVRIEVPS